MSEQSKLVAGFIFYLAFAVGWPFILYSEYTDTKQIIERSQEGVLTIREDRGSGRKGYRNYTGKIDSTIVFIQVRFTTDVDVKVGSSYAVLYDPNALSDYAYSNKGQFYSFRFGHKNESAFDIHLRHRGRNQFSYMLLVGFIWLIGAFVLFRKIRRIQKIRFVRMPALKRRGYQNLD